MVRLSGFAILAGCLVADLVIVPLLRRAVFPMMDRTITRIVTAAQQSKKESK